MADPRDPLVGPIRTYREVAAILRCHWTAVWQAERRALKKLAADPVLAKMAEDCK